MESIHAPQDKDYFVPANSTATVTLAAGDKKTVEIAVERKNVVTPKARNGKTGHRGPSVRNLRPLTPEQEAALEA